MQSYFHSRLCSYYIYNMKNFLINFFFTISSSSRLMYWMLTLFLTPPSSANSSCTPIQHKFYIPATFTSRLLSDVLSCLPSPPPRCGGLWQPLPDSFVSITLIRRPDSLQSPLSQAPPKRELACCLTGEGYFLFIWTGCGGLVRQTCFLQV